MNPFKDPSVASAIAIMKVPLPTVMKDARIALDLEKARGAFEDYIDQRDALWRVLTYGEQGLIRASEIDHLAARNEFVANLLKTKVVSKLFLAERIGIELLRVKVCDVFIARVRLEIAGLDTTPKVEPMTVMQTGIEAYRENLVGSPH